MDLIGWLLRLVFFVLALWFALQNTDPVLLHLGPNHFWTVQLVVVILTCFIAGALAMWVALVPYMLKQRRRITVLTRSAGQQPAGPEVAPESLTDVARQVGAVGGLDTENRVRRR
jgi:uncharacterized integral membrane protein